MEHLFEYEATNFLEDNCECYGSCEGDCEGGCKGHNSRQMANVNYPNYF